MFTQNERLLKITTPLGPDALVLTHFSGIEGVSKPFRFELTLFSSSNNITPQKLLGKNVTVTLGNPAMPTRLFNGIITNFRPGNVDYQPHCQYLATLAPWYKSFDFVENCRIFQQQTVPQIFTSLCKEQGFSHYDISQLKNSYTPLPYCVQYNETNLAFLQRLLAQAGIFFYFEHTNQAHTLILADQSASCPQLEQPCIYRGQHPTEQHIDRWQPNNHFHATAVTLRDYNFTQPKQPLTATAKLNDEQPSAAGIDQFNLNHYPSAFQQTPAGQVLAKQIVKALTWQAHQVHGNSNYVTLEPAHPFTLSEHPDGSQIGDYFPIEVHHFAEDMSHTAKNTEVQTDENADLTQQYHNQFVCIPTRYPFIPMPNQPKPNLQGHHTAIVVGPKNQAIYTDQYNRVKVQFEWDRYGNNNENSTCWLRVSQAQAGSNWGSQFIPRIGDEVNVTFINSDPDRPIITGSAYNATNKEPFPLPTHANISGITTHILGSQDPTQGHKLQFDDTPNKELVTQHSEKTTNINVNNDLTRQLGGTDTTVTNGTHTITAQSGKGEFSGQTMHFNVAGNQITLGAEGITIKPGGGNKLTLNAAGVGSSRPIARVGDGHNCHKISAAGVHKGGKIFTGSSFTKANTMAVATVGDKAHCLVTHDKIKKGVDPITVGGKPIAIQSSKCEHGGAITSGSPNVFVGERGVVIPNVPKFVPQEKTCQLTAMTVECGHSKRGFILDAKNGQPTVDKLYILQVLAGDKTPDRVKLKFQGQCHNAQHGPQPCPGVDVTTPMKRIQETSSNLIDVYSSPNATIHKNFVTFIKQILLPNGSPNIYQLDPLCCDDPKAHPITIEAFAPVEWEGEITAGYSFKQKDAKEELRKMHATKTLARNRDMKLQELGTWGLDGEIKVTRNDESWSLGANKEKEQDKKTPLSQEIFRHAKTFLDKITPYIGSIYTDEGSVKIDWPKLSLKGKVKNKEIPGKYLVGLAGEIALAFDPFIGISAEAKILNWLITFAGGGLGHYLLKIKDDVESGKLDSKHAGVKGQINVNFNANADIKGHTKWTKEPTENWKFDGGINNQLAFELKGIVTGELHFFVFKAAGGVIASGQSAVGLIFKPCLSEEGAPAVNMQFHFNGLTVYFTAYYEISGEHENTGHENQMPPQHTEEIEGTDKSSASIGKQYTSTTTLIKEAYWPEQPIVIPLNHGAI